MKKRDYICLMMAVTMILTGVSCGSADEGGVTAGGAANGFAAGDAAEAAPSVKGGAETADGDTAGADAGAAAETAAAAAEETVPAAEAEEGYAEDADGSARYALDGLTGDTAMMGAGTADEAEAYGAEGAPIASVKKSAEGETPAADTDDAVPEPEPEPEEAELPEAGLLTAGEWNDNDNWGFFTNLVNAGTIGFPVFGLDPTERTAVTVKDKSGDPVVNAKVVLKSDGKDVWSAVTDKNGTAYLFGSGSEFTVTSEGKSESYELEAKEKDEQGNTTGGGSETEVVFDGGDKLYSDMQVRFIVDTTGSMSDEMLFLQSEFSAITREVGTDGITYGVSFYRDEGDDYVTKHLDFTSDVSQIQKSLNNETADGGGDFPEAVAQVLSETVTNGEWSEDSVKIAFLIFDAPPHDGTEDELMAAAEAAGEKGIRIVPIVSSGSDRDTELFARSLAIMSGGTYVFLTDDSGIGGSHLEPIIGDYEVEKLYDIIVRVIGEYKQ